MSLNRWQVLWRSIDEARLIVRVMLLAKFSALVAYVFYGTTSYHGFIDEALAQAATGGTNWGELVPVLAAITAFYSITIPVLSKMYLDAWKDYRQSGVDWQNVEARAAVGAENLQPASGAQS